MSSNDSLLRPELSDLSPYNAGLSLEDVTNRCGDIPIAKLASNENPYGHPDSVAQAMAAALRDAHLYPDPSGRKLATEIARQVDCDADQVILGDGSEDLLNVLARATLRPGDKVVTLYPSFPLHEDYARMMGAEVVHVGLTPDGEIDVPALAIAASEPVRLTIFANPMNPTGLWLTEPDLDLVLAAQHPDSVLCLDEAYLEYAAGPGYLAATERLKTHDKPLIILRTFSKAYGLAALRIGYGIANRAELLRGLNLVRTPFNVNAIAQAGALAALQAPETMLRMVKLVAAERSRMANALEALGLRVLPSRGNFLFVETGRASSKVSDALIDRGVLVKPWKQPGYESWIRVSVGLELENTQFLNAISEILPGRRTSGN